MTLIEELGDDPHRRWTVLRNDGCNHGSHVFLGDCPKQRLQIGMPDGLPAKRHSLVQETEGIPHAALAGSRHSGKAAVFHRDALLSRDVTQALDDLGPRDPPEIVVLAT